ncbi:serine/threonine protein kinase [Nocardiopsis listeri]|uniref:serine/threonine protein kinase n=1 Tax=Nocardiopsis listeri TaxID=53440 RepID=UPI00082A1482|nr:hypothetical protein [Nocardiopsis listeri]
MSTDLPHPDRDLLPPEVTPPGRRDPESVGPYRLIGRIVRDTAGTVMLGVDPGGTMVAVRIVPAEVADATNVRARLTAEVGRLVRGRVVCAAGYRGSDIQAAEPWLATEYAPGRSLATHLVEHGPLRGDVLTALAVGLAEALSAWHALGGAHLGLGPDKVVLSPTGPKVVDLGVASAVGRPIGNPRWAAPEQGGSGPEANGSADVFAWGHLVRFAATGWEPSGVTVTEPDLGDVPDSLAPLVREALLEEPGERPTAQRLLQELTGRSEDDLSATVSGFLSETWTGVTVPEPRRVRRSRVPVSVGATTIVLAAALLTGWLAVDAGEDADDAAGEAEDSTDTTSTDAEGSVAEEPSVPTVTEAPENVDAVMAETIELALEASSFTTFEHHHHNSVGDTTPVHYLQTDEPIPAISRASYLGPTGMGAMALGSDLQEVVNLQVLPGEEMERLHYRDSDTGSEPLEHPREQWEDLVEEIGQVLEMAEPGYQGTGTAPSEYLPPEILGDGDLSERTGHRYTATYVQEGFRDYGPLEATLDFWVDETGYPLRLERRMETEETIAETGETLVFTHLVEFARFDLPVDAQVPTDEEILPEHPGH